MRYSLISHLEEMPQLRRCQECGQPLGKRDVFCPRCGARQPREPKERAIRCSPKKHRVAAPVG